MLGKHRARPASRARGRPPDLASAQRERAAAVGLETTPVAEGAAEKGQAAYFVSPVRAGRFSGERCGRRRPCGAAGRARARRGPRASSSRSTGARHAAPRRTRAGVSPAQPGARGGKARGQGQPPCPFPAQPEMRRCPELRDPGLRPPPPRRARAQWSPERGARVQWAQPRAAEAEAQARPRPLARGRRGRTVGTQAVTGPPPPSPPSPPSRAKSAVLAAAGLQQRAVQRPCTTAPGCRAARLCCARVPTATSRRLRAASAQTGPGP
ncbi:protein FAM246C-like [Diceros bicornis minor]|uniref:protein FAM246C-like n=1 Tax=Diceros bicornis minor TaxID=77932 RepID=UPI0026ECE619|nr:protein FAM246C-like [Diceros bicornis minor]